VSFRYNKNSAERVYSYLERSYQTVINRINDAKKRLPKIVLVRILRNSTFETVAENLRKAMQEGRYV
jgi:hypothetical protein